MYRWKCWREYRKITLLLMVLAAVITWLTDYVALHTPRVEGGAQIQGLTVKFIASLGEVHAILIMLLGVFAGCIVSAGGGLGREFDSRTPEFLYTLPVKRSRFLWMNWGSGLLAMLCVMAVPVVFYYGLCLFRVHRLGTMMLFNTVLWAVPLSLMLFGVGQLGGVLLQGAPKGAAISCSAVGMYIFAGWATARYNLPVPGWMHYYGYPNYAAGHGMSCLIWLVIALVFPVVTQRLLEKRDI